MATNEYHEVVNRLEDGLVKCAKRSFENHSSTFVDGRDIFSHFTNLWATPERRDNLVDRTPHR